VVAERDAVQNSRKQSSVNRRSRKEFFDQDSIARRGLGVGMPPLNSGKTGKGRGDVFNGAPESDTVVFRQHEVSPRKQDGRRALNAPSRSSGQMMSVGAAEAFFGAGVEVEEVVAEGGAVCD